MHVLSSANEIMYTYRYFQVAKMMEGNGYVF